MSLQLSLMIGQRDNAKINSKYFVKAQSEMDQILFNGMYYPCSILS